MFFIHFSFFYSFFFPILQILFKLFFFFFSKFHFIFFSYMPHYAILRNTICPNKIRILNPFSIIDLFLTSFQVNSKNCSKPFKVHADGTDFVVEAGETTVIVNTPTGEQNQQWKVCFSPDRKSVSFLSMSNG